ncbi:hypothetical protein BV210_06215 [Halorientalis sp. IM1011]|uniref:DUF7282 domain-containing protein n=1 Tax=Halorientalis sp. IM1011 TaxID=1932360 RepID=UPI00097CCFBF|nr:PGF-CTERM sorting domain-containing protein [Halorientalis sp. IM1011]AQL42330.1 hypothetical protein BV210_06215 [Halorientalis sp. IM1011]
MQLKPLLSGLALVALLAAVLAGSSVAAAAGSSTIDVTQSTNETVTNDTANGTTANATVGSLTVWSASTDRFAELSAVAAIQDGIQAGWLTRDRTVAKDDTVVFALSAPDLTATVGAANAIDRERAFVQAVTDSERYSFRVEQTVESTLAEKRPKMLNLSATRLGGALQVTPDERNGTLYVALRTDRANFETEYRDVVSARTGDAYVVTVTAGNVSSTTNIEIVDPPISFDTDAGSVVRFGIERCGLVTGHAYPGADVEIDANVVSPESGTFVVETTTRTTENGRFAACVNTTDLPSNATLRLTADGFRGAVTGVIGSSEPPSISLEDQNATNGTVTADVTLFDPGFVALYRASSIDALSPANDTGRCTFPPYLDRRAAESRLVGVSDHLGPGQDTVSVELTGDLNRSTRLLALVHYDRDDDGQFDYPGVDYPECVSGGDPVSDTATISPAGQSPSDSGSANGTASDASPSTVTTASNTTTADGPGFGPAVAVLALLAATLLARRRF